MAYVTITKQIGQTKVEFQNVDALLQDKVNQMLDNKISKGVPISLIREQMDKFQYPSVVIDGVDEENEAPKLITKESDPQEPKKRHKPRGDKAALVCELYSKMKADGATMKQMIDSAMAQFDMAYANAYYYYKQVWEKSNK